MLPSARRWVSEHPRLAVSLYALAFAAVALLLTRPVLLVNDGQIYFEMARGMRHGTLEIFNGLDVVDSPELWIENAVKRGPHIYAKYPPFYGILAVAPYALFGIRGLYLLNALGFVASVLGFHELARRVLGSRRALVATLLLPFGLPLVPYMLTELPHLAALAPFLWAIVLWDDARQAHGRRALGLAMGAGLLAGIAFGVRIQDLVVTAPLFGVAFFHARDRWRTLGGLSVGFGVCVLAVGAFNLQRFGTPNPFSYGPADSALGAPHPEDQSSFFLQLALVADFAIVVGVVLLGRICRRASSAWWIAEAGAVVIAIVPALRHVALHLVASTAVILLNAGVAGSGWSTPDNTFGWIDKALLSSTPFLVLGLVGMVACTARRAPPLQTALAWMPLALLLFLSVRDPDPRTQRAAMGFMSLSPRYLVEVMPGLYLLAWDRLRDVRFTPWHLAAGIVAAVVLFAFMQSTGRDDLVPAKLALITTASIVAAGILFVAYRARRGWMGAAALGLLVALTHGYAAACIFAEDSRCFREMAAVHERWGDWVLAAMPEPRVAIVGWHYAKDPIFHVRARKAAVVVDPSVDNGASVLGTLDALTTSGTTPYYFGLELERVLPRLEGHYRTVPVLDDPLLWRFDRIDGAVEQVNRKN